MSKLPEQSFYYLFPRTYTEIDCTSRMSRRSELKSPPKSRQIPIKCALCSESFLRLEARIKTPYGKTVGRFIKQNVSTFEATSRRVPRVNEKKTSPIICFSGQARTTGSSKLDSKLRRDASPSSLRYARLYRAGEREPSTPNLRQDAK